MFSKIEPFMWKTFVSRSCCQRMGLGQRMAIDWKQYLQQPTARSLDAAAIRKTTSAGFEERGATSV